mmetsp:Transcript_3449/g.10707  ORF Transcript_3449/g.10707 Transcript_3449/m.10707 type:complete len:315 (+) Transcript_3449:154-1098(+)
MLGPLASLRAREEAAADRPGACPRSRAAAAPRCWHVRRRGHLRLPAGAGLGPGASGCRSTRHDASGPERGAEGPRGAVPAELVVPEVRGARRVWQDQVADATELLRPGHGARLQPEGQSHEAAAEHDNIVVAGKEAEADKPARCEPSFAHGKSVPVPVVFAVAVAAEVPRLPALGPRAPTDEVDTVEGRPQLLGRGQAREPREALLRAALERQVARWQRARRPRRGLPNDEAAGCAGSPAVFKSPSVLARRPPQGAPLPAAATGECPSHRNSAARCYRQGRPLAAQPWACQHADTSQRGLQLHRRCCASQDYSA